MKFIKLFLVAMLSLACWTHTYWKDSVSWQLEGLFGLTVGIVIIYLSLKVITDLMS